MSNTTRSYHSKLNVFEKYLKLIKIDDIRYFTEIAILKFPEYFWSLPASTSGKHHGGEKLINHVLACAYIAKNVQEQFKDCSQIWKDQLMSAVLLHDGWRCGFPGHEQRITQKIIDKKGYSQNLLGNLCTSKNHPYVAACELKKIFNNQQFEFSYEMIENIIEAVKYHMGPWTPKEKKYYNIETIIWFGGLSYDCLISQVHNIDVHQTWNAQYNHKKKF